MRAVALTAALLGLATVAGADDLPFDTEAMERCIGLTEDPDKKALCIGRAAEACMEAAPGGYSTMAMVACMDAERAWWDARLNADYQRLMAAAKAFDEDMAVEQNNLLSAEHSLRDMQRKWIGFRDAACDFARAPWAGGTGQGPAAMGCLMRMTAKQALEIEAAQHELGGL